MDAEKLLAASKIAGLCLFALVAAWLTLEHIASPDALTPWRTLWLTASCVAVVATVLPIALVHAGLKSWADDALERLKAAERAQRLG